MHQNVPAAATARSRSRARLAARRRRALSVLLAALAVPVVVGLATGAAAAWWVAVCLLPVVCAYLAVMFRARRMSAEREINVAFFGGPQRGAFGLDDVVTESYETEGLRAAAGR